MMKVQAPILVDDRLAIEDSSRGIEQQRESDPVQQIDAGSPHKGSSLSPTACLRRRIRG
mgnify:FL=1